MPEYKQVTLKDPKTGDYLVPRVYGTLGYQVVEGQTISPLQPIDSIPSGIITLWSGASDAVPTGWALCDGQNGTPDLRNRFVVGAGSSYAVGATGGSDTVALTTAQMPSHKHSFSGSSHSHTLSGTASGTLRGSDPSSGAGGNYVSTNAYNYNSISVSLSLSGSTGSASTSGTIGNTGSGQAHENRPPYYALCYIMKL